MIVLASISLPKVKRIREENNSRNLGRLFVPVHRGSIQATIDAGIPCAGDNGCFGGLDQKAVMSLLRSLKGRRELLFFPPPDVVGDARATRERFDEWEPIVREHGLRVAYVLQDGPDHDKVEPPWDRMDALFIGGKSDRWKVGPFVRAVVRKAKALGKWVHMGRVNSVKRVRTAYLMGCDSVDGSGLGRFADTKLPKILAFLNKATGVRPRHVPRLDSFGSVGA